MARIGVYILSCLLLCGLLRLGTGRPTGAPVEVCNRQNLMPLHLANVVNGAEIEAQRDTDLSTNQSPYVVILKDSPQDQKYDATTTLKVQVVRNPQYTETALVNFKGMLLQMRAGDPALPVGKFELDQNLPENQVLGYDFLPNFQFLQCPRLNNFGNNIFDDNSVTHTNANDKVLANFAGPIFTWRPTTNDGLWNPNTGYGAIHAKASIVKDRQTFWVSLQTSFLEFRSPCGDNGNLMNGVCVCNGDFFGDTCQLTCGLFGNRINGVCVCNVNNDGWFGDLCQYNCNNGPGSTPPCQNFGTCNNDFQARNNGQYCTCQPTYTGPFCGTQLQTVCTTNNPCQNNGVCTDLSNGLYTCTCLSNYFGTNCEYHCQFSPPNCLNNGICNTNVQTQTNEPCACFSNFFGPFCQFSTACNPNPCLNSGACVEQAGGGYTCSCSSGYFGTNCQYHCQNSPPPCTNGFCNNDLTSQNTQPCICFANFGGLFCEQSLVCNPNPCLNGGACSINNGVNGGFTCACNSALGFFGDTCQYNCNQQMFPPCQNGGACNTNPNTQATQLCSCPSNAAGSLCASFIRCPDNINQPQSGNGQTAVQWAVPQMIGFANVQPFFSYSTIGGALSTTSTFDGRVQAFFSVGPTTVTVQGTDGVLDVSCTFVVTIDANPCSNFPCQNNGLCAPTGQSGFSCDCSNTGYIGLTCTSDDCYVPGACPNGQCSRCDDINQCVKDPVSGTFLLCSDACANNNPCNNNGMCFSNGNGGFTCQCFDGWTGQECIEPAGCNLTPCNSVGTQQCLPQGQTGYVCICTSDWAGTNCEYQNPCRVNLGPDGVENTCNPGICTLVQPFRPYPVSTVFADFTCECPGPDLGGQFCTIAICNPNCVNGQCEYNTLQSASFCQCFPGWTGIDCTTPLCTPACQNAGICQVFGTVGTCDCSGIPFDGPTCEIPVCSPFCQNGGTCSNINGQPICQCPQGFSGIDCSIPVCSPFCQNGGTCVNINGQPICQCLAGFTGIDCSTPVCSPFCQNGGTCLNINGQPICQCRSGFTGNDCSTPVCTPTCLNGQCVVSNFGTPICQCPSGYTGNDCGTLFCSPPCINGGVCGINGGTLPVCQCPLGYTGFDCGTPTGCTIDPCENGGICSFIGTTGYSCECTDPYFGPTCGQRDDCLVNTCQNGGLCTININGEFDTCVNCNLGYSGRYCEVYNPCTPGAHQCQNGICQVTTSNNYDCICFNQWFGPFCDQVPDGCNNLPCQNNGNCVPDGPSGFTCNCINGYFGTTCLYRDECIWGDVNGPIICLNGGTCRSDTNTGTTGTTGTGIFIQCDNCDTGYSGRYCQIDVCASHQCQNGNCVPTGIATYNCECNPNFGGQYCTEPLQCNPSPCQNGGVCVPMGTSYRCDCPPGYFGNTCQNPTACDSNPCQNEGFCTHTADGGYICQCTTSWTGPYCTIPRACQPGSANPCQNNGICTPTPGSTPDFRCQCTPLWTGIYCEEPIACQDPNICQNNGVCQYDSSGAFTRCRCPPGYFGTYCERDGCAQNPCGDHGYCDTIDSQEGFLCTCFDGYTGRTCDIAPVCGFGFANDPCQPNGLCQLDPTEPSGYVCLCYDEFSGDRCEIRDPCYNDPCLNGGDCRGDGLGSYTCHCYNGYTGLRCENRPVCSNNPCYNGGECYPAATGLQYRCECIIPYIGTRCEILSGCHDYPCGEHGECISDGSGSYRCDCIQGYTGRHCTIAPVCLNDPCHYGRCEATSNGNQVCICNPGYTGTYCERDACYDHSCYNGGTCEFNPNNGQTSCRCPTEFQGAYCEIPAFRLCDINICLNGGTCWDEPEQGSVCTCIPGYGGDLCGHRIISCAERICIYGDCIEADESRGKTSRCRCNTGWQGPQCDERIPTACSPNPCKNGGACQLFSLYSANFQCICRPGYTGDYCEKRNQIVKGSASKSIIVSLWTTVTALAFGIIFGRL